MVDGLPAERTLSLSLEPGEHAGPVEDVLERVAGQG
jgi:hypothetical protein